jgi:hypothetical protein
MCVDVAVHPHHESELKVFWPRIVNITWHREQQRKSLLRDKKISNVFLSLVAGSLHKRGKKRRGKYYVQPEKLPASYLDARH